MMVSSSTLIPSALAAALVIGLAAAGPTEPAANIDMTAAPAAGPDSILTLTKEDLAVPGARVESELSEDFITISVPMLELDAGRPCRKVCQLRYYPENKRAYQCTKVCK